MLFNLVDFNENTKFNFTSAHEVFTCTTKLKTPPN